jgi:hypothetical protein
MFLALTFSAKHSLPGDTLSAKALSLRSASLREETLYEASLSLENLSTKLPSLWSSALLEGSLPSAPLGDLIGAPIQTPAYLTSQNRNGHCVRPFRPHISLAIRR